MIDEKTIIFKNFLISYIHSTMFLSNVISKIFAQKRTYARLTVSSKNLFLFWESAWTTLRNMIVLLENPKPGKEVGSATPPSIAKEGNLPQTASEPHFTYLRQCASP